jgi:hypothetical protein
MAILCKAANGCFIRLQTLWIMFFAKMVSMDGFSSVFPFQPLYVKVPGTKTFLSEDFFAGYPFPVMHSP